MILLKGHSLTPARKVPLEAMSLQLKERESTASITPADMTGIQVNSWLKDETEPGAGIVWQVKSIGKAFANRTTSVSLEHAIGTLKDRILFGDIKPPQITGNKSAKTCTAEQAIRYILKQQSDWVLGSFDYKNVSNPYKFDGETLFDALQTVSGSLEGSWWSYDFSVYPFRLNITRMQDAVGSELRAGRNLKTITQTVDRSGMFTRFYPIGQNDLHVDGDYVEKNTDAYGVVSKVETDQSITTKEELVRWANERLRDHAEPTVSIDVEGYELAAATGESMDRLKLGAKCRVPLPEFGTTITERIVSLTYSDKLRQPEVVRITLANNKNDVTKILAEAIKKGGSGGRAAAKRDKEDNAWFEDTNDHVAMCAKGIIGVDAQGNPNWLRLSTLQVDENGIYGEVKSVQKDVEVASTKITQNEDAIKLEAKRRAEDDGKLEASIKVEAGKISQVVQAVGKDGKVTAASIVLAINNSSGESEAKIDAQRVYIGNEKSTTVISGKCKLSDVSADYISGQLATLSQIVGQSIAVGGGVYASDVYLSPVPMLGSSLKDAIKSLDISEVSGSPGTFQLRKKSYRDSDWVVVGTFDHAAPTTLTGSWDGRKYEVTASPQGNKESVTVYVHPVGSQGGAYVDLYTAEYDGAWTDHGPATRMTLSATGQRVDLKDGNGAVYAQLTVPNPTVTTTPSWSGKTFTVQAKIGSTVVSTETENVDVHAVGSQGGSYADMYVATPSGSSWTNHGTAKRLTLDKSGTTVQLKDGSTVLAQTTVTVSAAISFDCEDQGNPSVDKNDKPVTATAKNGTTVIGTANQVIHMTQGSWGSGKKAVNVRMTNDSGKLITRMWVSMPSTASFRVQRNGNQLIIYCTVGGREYSYTYNL